MHAALAPHENRMRPSTNSIQESTYLVHAPPRASDAVRTAQFTQQKLYTVTPPGYLGDLDPRQDTA